MNVEQNSTISTGSLSTFGSFVKMSTRTAQRVIGGAQSKLVAPSKITIPSIVDSKSEPTNRAASRIPRMPSPRCSTPVTPTNKTTAIPVADKATNTLRNGPVNQEALSKSESTAEKKSNFRRSPSNEHPNYITFHMGEPCTIGSLDHHLACGHKVLTTSPENCASNCKQPPNVRHANPRSIDQPFVCLACIVEQIKVDRTRKVQAFCDTMRQVANVTAKADPAEWIPQKVAVMEIAWEEIEMEQVKSRAAQGRFCHAFYIDEEFADLASAAMDGRRTQGVEPDRKPLEEASTRKNPEEPLASTAKDSKRSSKSPSTLPMPQKRA